MTVHDHDRYTEHDYTQHRHETDDRQGKWTAAVILMAVIAFFVYMLASGQGPTSRLDTPPEPRTTTVPTNLPSSPPR